MSNESLENAKRVIAEHLIFANRQMHAYEFAQSLVKEGKLTENDLKQLIGEYPQRIQNVDTPYKDWFSAWAEKRLKEPEKAMFAVIFGNL